MVVGCPLPLLAEGPGCGFPPLLAGVRCRWWWVIPRHSWLGAPGAVPRHSWLGSAGGGGGGGLFSWGRAGAFRAVCVCSAGGCACCPCFCVFFVFVVRVLVVVWVVWFGCVFRVRWCACMCAWSVSVFLVCLSPTLSAGACSLCSCGCGCFVLWVVPRHSWLRVLSAVPRHSWRGSAVGGVGWSLANPG